MKVAHETLQPPARPTRHHGLHLGPCWVVGTGDKIDVQIIKTRQRPHGVMGLHRGIKPAEVNQYPSGLEFWLNRPTTKLITQQCIPRPEPCLALTGNRKSVV